MVPGKVPSTAPVEVLLVQLRDGRRWRARCSGTGPDGAPLVVHFTGYDRADVAREAVIAWYARAEGRD